ncbi:hypothetical protein FRC06_008874, partial [Ceratobasidium sp. 370]
MDLTFDPGPDASMFAEDSEPEVAKPKTRKRVRKERQGSDASVEPPIKRGRGNRGKLKGLMNMPIEVFTEIAKYLYPLDLILLSRANKFFRQLLLSRTATQTWRHVLTNVDGLPPCPEELCEPQYAALMFTKYCSMCGKQAPRPMDPRLLVRLCVTCRDQQVCHVAQEDFGLIPMSSTILPAKKGRRYWFCLRHDATALHGELDALRLAGDRMATSLWIKRKKQEMEQRTNNAQPLIKFLEQQETEQSDSLVMRRGQREEAIRSRLLGLGWVEGDFEMREINGIKQWKSLVCVAKPLTERNWETILPQLTQLLERSRELRLEAEASQRRGQRFSKTDLWISSALRGLGPYARILDCPGNTTAIFGPGSNSPRIQETPGPSDASIVSTQCPTSALPTWRAEDVKLDDKVLKTSYPTNNIVRAWNPFKQLLDADVPMEEFEVALAGMEPTFNQLLVEWRVNLEKALIGRLPPRDPAVMEDSLVLTTHTTTPAGVVPELAIEVDSRPVKDLPRDTRRLLRADTVWSYTYSGVSYFYPDGFQETYSDIASSPAYSPKASEIANLLLTALGCPDAMYLQVKAAGPAFTCGKCGNCAGARWSSLLQHYLDEKAKWERIQKHTFFKDGQITYIFIHDTGAMQDDRPLVRMASDEERSSNLTLYGTRPCLICMPMGAGGNYYRTEAGVMDHIRQV